MRNIAGVFYVTFLLTHLVSSGDIFDQLAEFKDNVINGLFGKSKCSCPCRDYYVPKCEMNYVEQCRYEGYDHQQVCDNVPVAVVRQAKVTECQKCRKYYETVPVMKYVKECVPVYDEKCHTEYHQHCRTDTRCVMIYQTVCNSKPSVGYGPYKRSPEGYGTEEHCRREPRQHCYPETKCHRSPETKCYPIQKENCAKVPKETFEQVERQQCLPFEYTAAELEAMHNYDPCAQVQNGYSAPSVDYHAEPDHHYSQVRTASPNEFQETIPHHGQHQATQVDHHELVQPPPLSSYNGPDPLAELHDGIEQLFHGKRNSDTTTQLTQSKAEESYFNPFLVSTRKSIVYDSNGWVPLMP